MNRDREGRAFVVCGPSGAGKTTLLDDLLAFDRSLHFSVSWTTRERRDGERDGLDYHFVSVDQFRAEAGDGHGMLEWANVHGHLYGTPRSEVVPHLQGGQDVVLDIDVQGASQVRATGVPAVFVFVLPPSTAELKRRLVNRESETPESLQVRLGRAANEIACWPLFDYVIVNQDLDQARVDLRAIVLAERLRVRRGERPSGWQGDLPPEWVHDA